MSWEEKPDRRERENKYVLNQNAMQSGRLPHALSAISPIPRESVLFEKCHSFHIICTSCGKTTD